MFHNYLFLRWFNKIYLKNSSLTCFDTLSYTHDNDIEIKLANITLSNVESLIKSVLKQGLYSLFGGNKGKLLPIWYKNDLGVDMEQYKNLLMVVLTQVTILNAIILGALLLTVIISAIFKNKLNFKRIASSCVVIIVCIIIEFSFFAVPRIIDIKEQDYIVCENSSISIEAMNKYDGSFLVYGIGKVKLESGKSITVTGTAFVDLPTDSSAYQVFNGTVVYAKHSKQIVDFKKSM